MFKIIEAPEWLNQKCRKALSKLSEAEKQEVYKKVEFLYNEQGNLTLSRCWKMALGVE